MRHNKACLYILLALIILTVLLIWGQSVKGVPQSSRESKVVTELVEPVIEPVIGEGKVTDGLVRKLAHFVEFFILGCELMCLIWISGRRIYAAVVVAAIASLCIAALDETIQLFSGRGAQLRDVLLDFAGAATGMLITFLLGLAVKSIIKLSAKRKR